MRKGNLLFSPEGHRKYLSWSEREAFAQAVKSCQDPAKRAFCFTLFFTGCRISEALELTAERVDFAEKTIVFRTLKRRDPNAYRIVPVPDTLILLLGELARTRASFKSRLWPMTRPTGYRLIKNYMREAGISGIKACPKGLRHGFAVACVTRGVPVTTVQRWMGHTSLETTAVYLNMIGEEDRKQAEKLWRLL